MKNNQIQIPKKEYTKGEYGYKTFSIRIKEETINALDKIVSESNRSRNELINLFLVKTMKLWNNLLTTRAIQSPE